MISALHAGDSFGELSLMYNIRREATFRAAEDTQLLVQSSARHVPDISICSLFRSLTARSLRRSQAAIGIRSMRALHGDLERGRDNGRRKFKEYCDLVDEVGEGKDADELL